jgi:hypothetical protein
MALMRYCNESQRWLLAPLGALVLVAAFGLPAHAQTVKYSLALSTDFDLLKNPDDATVQAYAVWKTPTQMAALRASPMIRLTNEPDSDWAITAFRLDMGMSNYVFDTFSFLERPQGVFANLTSHTDMTFGGDRQPFLLVEIPQGLAPGQSLTFQTRLLRNGSSSLMVYEDVLWQRDQNPSNRLDNGLLSVTFSPLSGPNPEVFTTTPIRLFDFPRANQTLGPDSDGVAGRSLFLNGSMKNMADVSYARISHSMAVPEPTSAALAATGLLSLAAWRWRRRRRNDT